MQHVDEIAQLTLQLKELRRAIIAALDELDEAEPGESDPFIVAAQNILRSALKNRSI